MVVMDCTLVQFYIKKKNKNLSNGDTNIALNLHYSVMNESGGSNWIFRATSDST